MRIPSMIAVSVVVSLVACSGGPTSSGVSSETAPSVQFPEGADAAARAISAEQLRLTVTSIASDELMGRGPGTEGDRLARQYLAQRLEGAGFEPAFGDEQWEQPLQIIGMTTALPETWDFRDQKGKKLALRRWDEYWGATGMQKESASIENAEVVFVGYGITAPEENWDDFKGADLSGKVLLMLNDDPEWDPALFAGERKLY